MDKEHTSKMYRIGPFARHMGVTPDLLKHYEQFHLIESVPSESGYRYYPFSQSARLLAAVSLRGYGFSLREIDGLLGGAKPGEIRRALDAQGKNIEREILFRQAVLAEQRQFSAWLERMSDRRWDCRVEELGALCFLPHTRHWDFLSDDRIYEILKDWTDWMPVVKSCLEIPLSPDPFSARNRDESFWGLILPQSLAEKYAIPLNDAVKRIPGRKWLICNYMISPPFDPERPTLMERLQDELDRRGLAPADTIYNTLLLRTQTDHSGPSVSRLGFFLVPVC